MIRFFDILFSFLGILFLSPVFLFLYIAIRLESKGGGFYKQLDRKSTRLNSSHNNQSRMPSSA